VKAKPLLRFSKKRTVTEGGSWEWLEGHAIAGGEKYALCRCGFSEKKPFCDGTHAKAGFDGTETASRASFREQATVTEGSTLALEDADPLCAAARFCDGNLTDGRQDGIA